MAEFIYVLEKARKAHGDKVILDDVTLAFFPGAKIGVVGPNGMGKSTLLKIMAGLEEVSNGEARLTPGYTVGLLQQEPPLMEDATVKENVEAAFADVIALDAMPIAEEAGSAKAVNVVLIGVLSRLMPFAEEVWMKAIEETVPEKFVEMNKKAFNLGRNA